MEEEWARIMRSAGPFFEPRRQQELRTSQDNQNLEKGIRFGALDQTGLDRLND